MEKSLKEYKLILQIDPDNYWATLGIGNLYLYELNNLAKAELYFLRAMRLDPDQWFTYSSLADLYERKGDYPTATSLRDEAHKVKLGIHPSENVKGFIIPESLS